MSRKVPAAMFADISLSQPQERQAPRAENFRKAEFTAPPRLLHCQAVIRALR